MTKEKKVTKDELVEMIRGMVKESLEAKTKPLNEEKKVTNKVSVKQLREMVREAIQEVLSEEKEQD